MTGLPGGPDPRDRMDWWAFARGAALVLLYTGFLVALSYCVVSGQAL